MLQKTALLYIELVDCTIMIFPTALALISSKLHQHIWLGATCTGRYIRRRRNAIAYSDCICNIKHTRQLTTHRHQFSEIRYYNSSVSNEICTHFVFCVGHIINCSGSIGCIFRNQILADMIRGPITNHSKVQQSADTVHVIRQIRYVRLYWQSKTTTKCIFDSDVFWAPCVSLYHRRRDSVQ